MTSIYQNKVIFENLLLVIAISSIVLITLNLFPSLNPLLLALLPLSLAAVYLATRYKGSFIIAYLFLCITFLENSEGIQVIELPFYLASLLLILFTIVELLRGSLSIKNPIDAFALTFLFLIPYGIIVGLINGGSLYLAIGETTYFFGLLAYFPTRKYLKKEHGLRVVLSIVGLIILYALIRNVINYRAIIINAVLPWETENARAASNEFLFLTASIFFLAFAATTKEKLKRVLSTIIFLMALGGLVLTQSRGYWLAFIVSAFFSFLFIDRTGKIKILVTFFSITIPSIIILQTFFTQELELIITGMSNRVLSIFSGKMDWSLYERVLESEQVFNRITNNPIAGHGLGVKFTKKKLFYDTYVQTSYVHNGYLATWFKFGIPGLIIIYTFWGLLIKRGVTLYKASLNETHKAIAVTISAVVLGAMLVNNTSPQILNFESVLFFALFAAFLSSYSYTDKENE